MADGSEPIADHEILYRRIPASAGFYDLNTDASPSPLAFRPTSRDTTGLSLYRSKYKPIEEAARGREGKQYFVAILRAGDLRRLRIEVSPRPLAGDPGHCEIAGLTYDHRKTMPFAEWQGLLAEQLCLRSPPIDGSSPSRRLRHHPESIRLMPTIWQTVRTFISSTFRDMHAERDQLVKVVFPRLPAAAAAFEIGGQAHFAPKTAQNEPVPNGSGVTKEDADNGKAIEICLHQIDGSRPFFLCLLGSRYGWVPDELPPEEMYQFRGLQAETHHGEGTACHWRIGYNYNGSCMNLLPGRC